MEGSVGLIERPSAQDQPDVGRLPFTVDVPFTRTVTGDEEKQAGTMIAHKGDLVLDGYASTWVLDRDQEYVSRHAFDSTLDAYLAKNPILLWQHMRDKPLGQVVKGQVDETGLAVEAIVRLPVKGEEPWRFTAYNDIKAGIVRTFSIGGFFDREIIEGEVLISQVELLETSCVSIPSNPDSIYSAAVKSLHGVTPGDSHAVVEQMVQLLGIEPVHDPGLARMDERARRAHYMALSAAFADAKDATPPSYESYRTLTSVVETGGLSSKEALGELERILGLLAKPDASKVSPPPDLKKGRVLSKANESKLRSAHGAIGEVLAKLEQEGDQEEASPDDEKAKPPKLRTGGGTTSCGGCVHWKSGQNDRGICKLYNYATARGAVCDSYEGKSAEDTDDKGTLDEFLDAQDGGELKASCVNKPWNGSASRFTDEQYRRSCVLDRADCSADWRDKPVKQRFSLPIREPGGAINKNAIGSARGRISSVSGACDAAKSKATSRLDRAASTCGGD